MNMHSSFQQQMQQAVTEEVQEQARLIGVGNPLGIVQATEVLS